ncbi:hypothetical protein Q428_11220 [Fervidicella metallireducens AeB]|uniref:Spore coat protein n=1 Tax=Fervidicella metallireducens AeB TaxID=1403537 RepID=A0A017RTN0_9CLOT
MNKKIYKKILLLSLTGILSFSTFTFAVSNKNETKYQVGNKISFKNLKLKNNTYIIDYKFEDVNGDKIKDHLILTGVKEKKQDIFSDNIDIVIENGKTHKITYANLKDFSGYNSSLFIGDFSGDKVKDIFVSADTGGSGGIVNHTIVTFKNDKPVIIFSEDNNEGLKLEGKFIDDFKAEITSNLINKKFIIDVSANKKEYTETKVYTKDGKESYLYDESGKVLTDYTVWGTPFSLLKPIDYDGDGTYSLEGYQRISGTCNADTISNVISIWSFINGKLQPVSAEYSNFLIK